MPRNTTTMKHRQRNASIFGMLGAATLMSYALAFALEFGTDTATWAPWFGIGVLPVLLIKLGTAWFLRVHRELWRYVGLRDLASTVQLVFTTSGSIILALVVLPTPQWMVTMAILDMLLSTIFVTLVRLTPRIVNEFSSQHTAKRNALVIGAGNAGEALLRELRLSKSHPYTAIGILDDDPLKLGHRIQGTTVIGSIDDLEEMVATHKPDVVLFAIYAISTERIQEVRSRVLSTGLPMKQVPTLAGLLHGRARIDQLRDFSPEELLSRPPIRVDREELHELVADSCVMVTGAAGSIGSELSRQLLSDGPRQLILLDNSESALFYIEHELRARNTPTQLIPVLCSVKDSAKVEEVFAEYRPEIVFHAAAYKHVPVLEHFPEEAVRTNVLGTRTVARTAHEYGCKRFVLISTDKAVRPTSVMGTTKRIAELIVADIARMSPTQFTTLRFGNVLGSNGSVVELFRRQIESGGPVTITHPEIQRFFMSIPEAVELVLFATAMDHDGGTFILNMGEQVKILDLAQTLIRLHGLEPGVDIAIEFTGLRPGEKLFEELWTEVERPSATAHSDILRAPRIGVLRNDFAEAIQVLIDAAQSRDRAKLLEMLKSIVPSYTASDVEPHSRKIPPVDGERASTA